MSGHSKWSTIKRQKGAADARRGNIFTKLSNSIAIAVREGGGGDPDSNFKLRLVVEKAKEANMPKDNIQRSIDRGLGKGEGAALESAVFEGFGPNGAAVIVETITDNTTRTASELRNVFEKSGGRLAGPGSVAYMFSRLGEIELSKSSKNSDLVTMDSVFEKAVEAGAEDVEENPDSFSVFTKAEDLHKVKDKLEGLGLAVLSSEIVYRPNKETMVTLTGEQEEKVHNLMLALDELDDVQNIFVNINIS